MNTFEKRVILFVDDEENNPKCIFANFIIDFTVLLASSIDEAIQIINTGNIIDIMISDYQLNGSITGLEFLYSINLNPMPIKIADSAHRDNPELESAPIAGRIFDFKDKPWQPEDLEKLIKNAINHLK